MPYIELESLDDARLDVFARLTEAQLRNKLEPEKGIFIVESEKVIDRALLGGVQPLSMLMTPEWVDRTREIVSRAEAACEEPGGMPVFVVPAKEAECLTGFAVTRGILLACRRPQLPSVEDLLARVDAEKAARAAAVAAGELDPGEVGNMHDASRRRIAVLEGIVDHTNVGAIFRSAAAMGIDAVLVTPTCCDPLYRRAVRVSMGCVFQVPWTRIGESVRDWPAAGLARLGIRRQPWPCPTIPFRLVRLSWRKSTSSRSCSAPRAMGCRTVLSRAAITRCAFPCAPGSIA